MLSIFVDESGDLGLNDSYFIIAMLISYDVKRLKNIAKNFCIKNNIVEIHACFLDFTKKQYLINKIAKQLDYSVYYIVVDKIMINQKKLFNNNSLLFNYLFSFLIKDVCQANTDDLHIYLDNRNQKVYSRNSLSDYIKIKAFAEWGFTKDLKIEYCDSRDVKVLQIVDLIANCIRRKYIWRESNFYDCLNIVKSIKFPKKMFRF